MVSIILPSYREPGITKFVEKVQKEFPYFQIIVSEDRYGKGKGWAIREALNIANGEFIAFLDGDGDIEPRMLYRLLPFIEDYDVVVGTKKITHKHLSRRIISFLSRLYIRLLFGIKVDSQTGIKVFRKKAIKAWETNGFIYDCEVLYRLQKSGCRMIEIPVDVDIKKKMSGRTLWKTLVESLILRCRLSSLARV